MEQVVFTRDELVEELAKRCSEPVDIARILEPVDRAFRMRNAAGRYAYLFEVPEGLSGDSIRMMNEAAWHIGVCMMLVPSGRLNFIGEYSEGDDNGR